MELARRYLRVFGPAPPQGFAGWAGIKPPRAKAAFDALGDELSPVQTPIGDGWILAADEPAFGAEASSPATGVRLLPSGDAYYLLQGSERELLVPESSQQAALWTSRVWPGAVLADGEIVGTWRRAEAVLTIQPWRRLSPGEVDGVEAEASILPLPGLSRKILVRWDPQLPSSG